MADSNTSSSHGGIGFVGLLTILFIALKLCDVIKWWWVLSPLWIAILIFVLILVGVLAFYFWKETKR